MDKGLSRPLKLPDGGAVVFGRKSGLCKRCRLSNASDPEKRLVVSDEVVHETSPESLPLDLLSPGQLHDQQCPEPADDNTGQVLVPISSSSGNETQQSGFFEEDCRAVAAAAKHELVASTYSLVTISWRPLTRSSSISGPQLKRWRRWPREGCMMNRRRWYGRSKR